MSEWIRLWKVTATMGKFVPTYLVSINVVLMYWHEYAIYSNFLPWFMQTKAVAGDLDQGLTVSFAKSMGNVISSFFSFRFVSHCRHNSWGFSLQPAPTSPAWVPYPWLETENGQVQCWLVFPFQEALIFLHPPWMSNISWLQPLSMPMIAYVSPKQSQVWHA